MSQGHTKSAPALGLEKFMGRNGEYTMWRDKFLTHISEMDQVYERGLLEKDQPAATVLMVDFLDGHPEEPVITVAEETSKEEARAMRWRCQHWIRAKSALLNLFNQSLTNVFLAGLPDSVSKMRPCDIWKELEQKYGVGDAGGVIQLRRQWDRVIASNWNNVGTLFAQLKKIRNDINRKMIGLVGKEMVTEHWLCMEVLAQLPNEFWGSTIHLTKELFTLEIVEANLRPVFQDRSKKEINMMTDKRRSAVPINVARNSRKKRSQDEASSTDANPSGCFYCFEESHRKKDCPVLVKDRNPKRQGGPLFRSNIHAEPVPPKKKRVATVKKGVRATAEKVTEVQRSPAEDMEFDRQLQKAIQEVDEFEFKEAVPASDGSADEAPMISMDIDDEGLDTL